MELCFQIPPKIYRVLGTYKTTNKIMGLQVQLSEFIMLNECATGGGMITGKRIRRTRKKSAPDMNLSQTPYYLTWDLP
jgi:hypothetical protein